MSQTALNPSKAVLRMATMVADNKNSDSFASNNPVQNRVRKAVDEAAAYICLTLGNAKDSHKCDPEHH